MKILKLYSKNNHEKLFFFQKSIESWVLGVVLLLILLSFWSGIAFRDYILKPNSQVVPTSTPQANTLTPTTLPYPTTVTVLTNFPTAFPQITKGPSDRALRASAYVFATSDAAYKESIKSRYGVDTINGLANFLDSHRDKLALVEQVMSIKNNHNNNRDCISELSSYAECMGNYQRDIEYYQRCMSDPGMTCNKPTNYCGSNPNCRN